MVGVPVGRRYGGWLATTLVATINAVRRFRRWASASSAARLVFLTLTYQKRFKTWNNNQPTTRNSSLDYYRIIQIVLRTFSLRLIHLKVFKDWFKIATTLLHITSKLFKKTSSKFIQVFKMFKDWFKIATTLLQITSKIFKKSLSKLIQDFKMFQDWYNTTSH